MYFLLLIDDYTRYRWVYFLVKKSDATAYIKAFVREIKSQHLEAKVGKFHTDNVGELLKGEIEIIVKVCRITIKIIVTYAPEQNSVAERSNRTILNKVRALLFDLGIPHVL
jgi:chemotaxis regulatin CheY-phosphate phosphatase CheZ